MSVNIKVILKKSFLDTAVTEVLNLAVSKQTLRDIANEIEQPGEYEIWVDSREGDSVLSMVDIDRLGNMLAAHPSLRESKVALVTSVSETKQADILESLTVDPALEAKGATGFEAAVVAAVNVK